ncbi:MAG: hypothetical protein AB7K09_22315 [Planctomycetota bacterium]
MRHLGPGWLVAMLAVMAAFAATPAAAQPHIWNGAEEQTGLGLHYSYSEVDTRLTDAESNDVDIPVSGFDRDRQTRRTTAGLTLLFSDPYVNGFFAPGFTWMVDQGAKTVDWSVSGSFGLAWNFYRIEFGDPPGAPSEPRESAWGTEASAANGGGGSGRRGRGLPNLTFGVGFSVHGYFAHREITANVDDVDYFGGEFSLVGHISLEIIEHLNIWFISTYSFGYQNDDGFENGLSMDRMWELQRQVGLGFGVSYRFNEFLLMFEAHFLSASTYTVTLAYLF